MKLKKFAAIDIGSNAIRILIANIIQTKNDIVFQKNSLIRSPVRLGEDSFSLGEISPKSLNRFVKTMKAFKLLMNIHGVSHYKAFATSALREANNSSHVIKTVKKKAGIKVEIIDGTKEAEIISNSKISEFINTQKTFLFVDVGGGSTEFTFINEGIHIVSKSFKIGTVRLINNLIDDRVWIGIENWIKKNSMKYEKITLMGSGGNINKLFKLSNIKEGKPLSKIHQPIADSEQLIEASDKLSQYMTKQEIKRWVWTITTNNNLSEFTEINKPSISNFENLYFRVETQTSAPIDDETSIFFIKIDVLPLKEVWSKHILDSINSMSDNILNYKGLVEVKDFLNRMDL